ncbi:MAG: 23S rRNA (adenine(2503)-C(2))-methyltransferase RlmN [Bacteroidetes bacterium]|nr:23S rRNA (adenine(2503)-C(2))-methyltransferase RlmN [Bacteroidota bacterium]
MDSRQTIRMDNSQPINLKSLTHQALRDYCSEQGIPSYRGDQLFQWMWQKEVHDLAEMSNLPKSLRESLEEVTSITQLERRKETRSKDGTIKILFETGREQSPPVEAVLIPDFDQEGAPQRMTVCVSSQVGCMFGCAFCATGKMGYFRNLEAWEIADQAVQMNRVALDAYGKGITNIVYMGMGEPLHNMRAVIDSVGMITSPLGLELSPKRITVSTVGLAKQIKQLAEQKAAFNLAISLHAPNDEKRDKIMPINESLNLSALREALETYYQAVQKPVTYEYLLFDEFNDSADDARALANIVSWIPSKVNIIMYNNVLGVELKRAREQRLDRFMQALSKRGVRATVRRSRGDDIDAGCGQLAIREGIAKGKSIAKA